MYHPSIILFRKGMSYEYQQRCTAAEMIAYCRRMLQPAVQRVDKLAQVVDLMEREPALLLAFLHPDHPEVEAMLTTAAENLMDRVRFAAVSHPQILHAFGVPVSPLPPPSTNEWLQVSVVRVRGFESVRNLIDRARFTVVKREAASERGESESETT